MRYKKSKEIEIICSFISYSYFLFTDKVTFHKKEKRVAKSDLYKIINKHLFSSADAFLSQCISEVNEELLILDFSQFKHTTREINKWIYILGLQRVAMMIFLCIQSCKHFWTSNGESSEKHIGSTCWLIYYLQFL